MTWTNNAQRCSGDPVALLRRALYQEFIWFGDHSASKTPGPIPNPAVKCRSADGTAS